MNKQSALRDSAKVTSLSLAQLVKYVRVCVYSDLPVYPSFCSLSPISHITMTFCVEISPFILSSQNAIARFCFRHQYHSLSLSFFVFRENKGHISCVEVPLTRPTATMH